MNNSKETTKKPVTEEKSRRKFLKLSVASGAAVASGGLISATVATSALADDFSVTDFDQSTPVGSRAEAAFKLRRKAARQHFNETLSLADQLDNNDEHRYKSQRFYASFSKTLPSNQYGEVNPAAFRQLRRAMRRGDSAEFDAIPLASFAERTLANPQGAFKFELSGIDNHATRINPSWKFRSADIAGEIGEVYWQALTRDVAFIDYDIDSDISAAITDLNNFSKTPGANSNGPVSSDTIFRGETSGDLTGPYISQFLWKDFNFGPVDVVQKYQTPVVGLDFMTDHTNWLHIQRGGAPTETAYFENSKRYIFNNRSLGEYVHKDVSFQAYLHSAMMLLSMGEDAIDPGNPYRNSIINQGAFTSLGAPFVLDMISKAANLALTGAWFQKWRVHRFLRPEALGGRINFHVNGQRQYELDGDILNSDALQQVFSRNGNYFLPQAFTEGSPTHPSYPAGHATVAGACVTMLKAFFDESFVLPDTVQADATGENLLSYNNTPLTVGNELNKLANNIAIGRNAAGVHYRQDGVQGLRSGEQQAIALLQDQSRTFNESGFDGFTFTKFDGTTVNIKNGNVI